MFVEWAAPRTATRETREPSMSGLSSCERCRIPPPDRFQGQCINLATSLRHEPLPNSSWLMDRHRRRRHQPENMTATTTYLHVNTRVYRRDMLSMSQTYVIYRPVKNRNVTGRWFQTLIDSSRRVPNQNIFVWNPHRSLPMAFWGAVPNKKQKTPDLLTKKSRIFSM